MKTTKKKSLASVIVPSLSAKELESYLLREAAKQDTNGWAYTEVGKMLRASYALGINPLKALRKILPQWTLALSELEWSTEEEHESACYSSYSTFCGLRDRATGETVEGVSINWAIGAGTSSRTFQVTAHREIADLTFVVKTTNGWAFVDFSTKIAVDKGWNIQPYPSYPSKLASLPPKRFRLFKELVPEGTQPQPVLKTGEERSWSDGAPWGTPGGAGRSGFEQDYRMPDGTVATKTVTTDEW